MSEKLKRLQALASSETKVSKKHVKVDGLDKLTAELKQMLAQQTQSQRELTKTLQQLGIAIAADNGDSVDLAPIVKSIESLTLAMAGNKQACSYSLSGQRDKNGLIDLNSIKFTAMKHKMK